MASRSVVVETKSRHRLPAPSHFSRKAFRYSHQKQLTNFMMKEMKSVTTVTALTRPRFLAMSQKAFLDDVQKDVLKIATWRIPRGGKRCRSREGVICREFTSYEKISREGGKCHARDISFLYRKTGIRC